MKWLPLFAIALVAVGCSAPKDTPEPPKSAAQTETNLTPIEGLSRYALAQPISYGSVAIVPIVDTSDNPKPAQQDLGDAISLAEAKKNGWIEIHEVPGGGEVNHLEVNNVGPKPILLLAGELLLGGQQDRIVAKDTVVPPGKMMKVPVFCVEHGRWEGEDKKFTGGMGMVPQSVREETASGEDQQGVWDKVAVYNRTAYRFSNTPAASGLSVKGGLFTKEVQEKIAADLPKFTKDLSAVKNVVGYVYVLNGKVQAAELFGSPRLFDAGREALLKGLLADSAVTKADPKANVSMSDCEAFFKDVMAGKRRQTALRAGNADWKVYSNDVSGTESTLPAAKASAPGAADSSGFLHGSYSKSDK